MARLTIYKDHHADTTTVSNCFIDYYMKDANDAQIKVYLYLLRMLNGNHSISVSDIADKFNHTERDVMRALNYWEEKQLLSLDYDEEQNLSGIHLRDLTGASGALNASSGSPSVSALPSKREPNATFTAAPSQTASFQKPNYTMDQLREFKSREETAQLLFIAQSYIGKPLTPSEIKSILFFMDELHFSEDLVDYLIQYCVDRNKKDFKYIEKVAISWAEQGITTPQQAQKISTKYDKDVYAIMNQLGKSNSPTVKELEFINRWTKEFGFSNEIIFEACQRTVMATDKHRFEYADSILSSWSKENVHRKSDILRIDELYQQKRKAAGRTTSNKAAANKFNQFQQNDYDFAELEKDILSN